MVQSSSDAVKPASVPEVSRLRRLHHSAFPIADSEKTRWFMEELLGVPLVATWAEAPGSPPEGAPEGNAEPPAMPSEWVAAGSASSFVHTFYQLADGGAVAFFQIEGEKFLIGHTNVFQHIALETDQAAQDAIHERLLAAGIEHVIIDHGYVNSLYVLSPDGLQFEICVDPDDVEVINKERRASAHEDLRRWLAGDHSSNHEWGARVAPQVFPGRRLYPDGKYAI